MGSGISIPDKLNEENVIRLCGSRFDKAKFEAIKDEDGFVTKENFLLAMDEGQEREVFELYMQFVPTGLMDSRTFIKFCRDTKLLNKKNFPSPDADLVFQKVKAKLVTSSKTINYDHFRKLIIPEIAQRKSMEVNDLIFKLSRAEGPVLTGTQAENVRLHDDVINYTESRFHTVRRSFISNNKNDTNYSNIYDPATANATPTDDNHTSTGHSRPSLTNDSIKKKSENKRPSFATESTGRRPSEESGIKRFSITDDTASRRTSTHTTPLKSLLSNASEVTLPTTSNISNGNSEHVSEPMASASTPNLPTVSDVTNTSTTPTSTAAAITSPSPAKTRRPSFAGGAISNQAIAPVTSSPIKSELVDSPAPAEGLNPNVAAVKLQKLQRAHLAKIESYHLKEVREVSKSESPPIDYTTTLHNQSEEETRLEILFQDFCPTGEMDNKSFLKICKDMTLMDRHFNINDIDLIFQKTKAKASLPNAGVYASGIVHGKRIKYKVFRGIAVPEIAQKKGVSVESLVVIMSTCTGPK